MVKNHAVEGINRKYLELCKRESLDPSILGNILFYRSKGFNNTAIADRLGLHRITVQNYVEKLRKMESEDFNKALVGALAIVGGAYLLSKILEE